MWKLVSFWYEWYQSEVSRMKNRSKVKKCNTFFYCCKWKLVSPWFQWYLLLHHWYAAWHASSSFSCKAEWYLLIWCTPSNDNIMIPLYICQSVCIWSQLSLLINTMLIQLIWNSQCLFDYYVIHTYTCHNHNHYTSVIT